MEITLDLIKELRNKTGAGINDCKKALQEVEGDLEKAVEYLRKKGAAMAVKRADKATNEGAVKLKISDDKKSGAIIEVNCETDFVSKGEEFQNLADAIANAAFDLKGDNVDNIHAAKAADGLSIKEKIDEFMGKVGEKIELRRADFVNVPDGFVAGYVHFGSKLGSLIGFKGTYSDDAEKLGKNIAMQVVAMNPLAIRRDDIDQSVIDKEKDIYMTLAKNENKPDNIAQTIVNNKVERFFQDNCLLEQEYINESSKSVKNLIEDFNKSNDAGIDVVKMIRYQLGGEKK
ncbi:MAG: elongation factor Ts [Ignavibacteria bacterium]|nr:elongation factor Ts [Ignavibacteria bacterium]MBK9225827.1 elongation factor Ts [Ignavibacteria bacterium]